MIVGMLSDSHGNFTRVRAALEIFDCEGAATLIHCGDVGGIEVFSEFVGRDLRFVWGNTDAPGVADRAFLESIDLQIPNGVPLRFEIEGKVFEVYHGHEPEFTCALADPRADYILHGHTHIRRDERLGGARVINPGALHRSPIHTVATLDLDADRLTFHEVR